MKRKIENEVICKMGKGLKCILRIRKMIKKRRYFFKLGYKRIGDVSKMGKKIQLLNFSRVYSVSTWKLCLCIFFLSNLKIGSGSSLSISFG